MLDSLIAFRVLYMLVTPFKDTKAFKLGLVDEKGVLLKSPEKSEEKDAYNMLVRLVFNLKRLLIKLPGGDSRLKNLAAAYFLVKENYEQDIDDEQLAEQLNALVSSNYFLVEETQTVLNFIAIFEEGEGAVPANRTGPGVQTQDAVVRKKRIPKFTRDALKDVQC